MNRCCRSFLLLLMVFSTSAYAQTKDTRHKTSHKRLPVKVLRDTARVQRMAIDTPKAASPAVVTVPATDTIKKDTNIVEKVAEVIHDSVKAQFKAPIVQVPVTLKSLIIPGALFAYGCITLNNGGLRIINEESKEIFWDRQEHHHPYLEDYTLLVPAATVYALNIFGVKGQNNLIDRSVLYGMSNLIANGFVFGLKRVGIETRPDSSDNHSFPSGHTAEAFVSAEFLHLEYRGRIHWSMIALGYGVGVGTAYLRMAHNKHWLSDVVAGAGVGIASTRFSYYLYPILKNWIFGSKKVKGTAMIMPVYSNEMVGLTGVWRF